MKEGRNRVYHARQDCWQALFGYNKLYDFGFALGTSMLKEIFEFSSGGKDYRIWAWKGDYINLGAGAELGIYQRMTILSLKTPHWVVNKDLAMKMSMTLSYGGINLIDYAPEELQWWITGFNSLYRNVPANRLIATYTVTFNSEQMYNDFYNKWGTGKHMDSRWTFNGIQSATLRF